MADDPTDHRSPRRQEGSKLSDASTAVAAPTVPIFPHQRHAYRRMDSQGSVEFADLPHRSISPNTSNFEFGSSHDEQGLGITAQVVSIRRVPVASRSSVTPPTPSKPFPTHSTDTKNSPLSPQTPGSSRPLLSPSWQRYESGNYASGSELGTPQDGNMDDQDVSEATRNVSNASLDMSFGVGEDQNGRRMSVNNDNDTTSMEVN